MASLEDLSKTIGQVGEKYNTHVSRDIALLDKLIGELEAKQCQPEWELMKVSVAGPGFPLPTVPSRMTWASSTAISSAQVSTRQRSCAQTPLMSPQESSVAQLTRDPLPPPRREKQGLGAVLLQARPGYHSGNKN